MPILCFIPSLFGIAHSNRSHQRSKRLLFVKSAQVAPTEGRSIAHIYLTKLKYIIRSIGQFNLFKDQIRAIIIPCVAGGLHSNVVIIGLLEFWTDLLNWRRDLFEYGNKTNW